MRAETATAVRAARESLCDLFNLVADDRDASPEPATARRVARYVEDALTKLDAACARLDKEDL